MNVSSMLAECEDCKEKFSISENITHKREFVIHFTSCDEIVYLTYYDCPKCGKRHFVQIDDNTSIGMLEDNRGQFRHNAKVKMSGIKLRKKKITGYKKTQKRLNEYRSKLMNKYTDCIIHDVITGTEYKLRFSV